MVSVMDRALVLARDGLRCVACRSQEDLTVDHIWPRKYGGGDELENLQTLCRTCNSAKGAGIEGRYPPRHMAWAPSTAPRVWPNMPASFAGDPDVPVDW